MVNLVPISASRHSGKAWRRPTSLAFASTQAVVPLVGAEFAKAALSMPTAFIDQAGSYVPVAVMSLVAGRNLFVGPAGQWLGGYIPAALRSYPFRLGRLEGAQEVALCIDEDTGLIVDSDGSAEDFIDAKGNLAPTTLAARNLLIAMEQSRSVTEVAVAALAEQGLIQPWQLEVTIDGQVTPVTGLFRVNEVALDKLDDPGFLRLRHAGALSLAYVQLQSIGQTVIFDHLSLSQQQLAQTQQKQQITSLDEIFKLTSNETLRFH